ncbi:MAG: lysophospholipid acyltransferase family protein [Hyphomicrobiaceae bacterium]
MGSNAADDGAIEDRDDAVRDERQSAPSLAEVFGAPLPALGFIDRALTKSLCGAAMQRFQAVRGLEHVRPELDPFVLALNHTSRFEAVALPALLMYRRGGRRVHFLADWNFQMIPGVGLLYRRSGAIVVMRKSARPRFLNALKPLYAHAEPSHARALAHLRAGRSVGIYPEGAVNHDPERLLRGRLGAARLSLEAGVPVVPAGIRRVGGSARWPLLDLTFGPPLRPPHRSEETVTRVDIRSWHSIIMSEISRLSGKAWEPLPQEPRHGTA